MQPAGNFKLVPIGETIQVRLHLPYIENIPVHVAEYMQK